MQMKLGIMSSNFHAPIIRSLLLHLLLTLNNQLDEIKVHAEAIKATATTSSPPPKTTSNTQETHQHYEQFTFHQSQSTIDTKYWIRDTEFGERNNWRNNMKPCTLLERIRINEQSVVSLGDSMDSLGGALEANIKQLTLAQNGMLLLEEDTLGGGGESGSEQAMFIQYMNETGDCLDSTGAAALVKTSEQELEQDGQMASADGHLFQFEPDRDQMSWFNPDNWVSRLNEIEFKDWIPDSHRIPCSHDVVVFGDSSQQKTTIEPNERGRVLSFKVNFEPSSRQEPLTSDKQVLASQTTTASGGGGGGVRPEQAKVNQLRVSKVRIGDHFYNQQEFEQLLKSEEYENILFEFNSSRSLLVHEDGFDYPSHSLLVIDESSLLPDANYDFCLDEAGCLCGNEQINIMKAICSFSLPIEQHEQPCHDPILSVGYCNKICATIITITMDPTRFKEQYLFYLLNQMLFDGENGRETFFPGARRTDYNKYEITFRHVPLEPDSDELTLGEEREFANQVVEGLENRAMRSFYGIKTVNIRSSIDWKRSNRFVMFLICLPVWTIAAAIVFLYEIGLNNRIDSNIDAEDNFAYIRNWFISAVRRLTPRIAQENDDGESFVGFAELSDAQPVEQVYISAPQIPLVELENVDDLADESPEIDSRY